MRFDAVPKSLLERCQTGTPAPPGSEDSFEELCRLIQPDLYAFLYNVLRSHEATDEALVECLVRLHRHLGKLQDLEKFPGWLMRMAVNQAQTVRARQSTHNMDQLEDGVEIAPNLLVGSARPTPSPRATLEQKEVHAEIDAAIAKLPERQRAAIVLFEIEQLPVREIAEQMECSEGAVKFHLHEARKKLRLLLGHLIPARKEPVR